MPRISAPTVAEHRAAQRAALLRAGEAVLLEASVAGVTPRSVCERAGLARSSFYDYFASKDDLLVAIAIDAIERWDAELEVALAATEPGAARLRSYVERTMAMTAEGRHAIAGALRDAPLSPSHRDDLMALHDAMLRPLATVLDELGLDTPTTTALVHGLLGTGMELVDQGVDPAEVSRQIMQMLSGGITATS
jgi:AcrR family transcriptional regulator